MQCSVYHETLEVPCQKAGIHACRGVQIQILCMCEGVCRNFNVTVPLCVCVCTISTHYRHHNEVYGHAFEHYRVDIVNTQAFTQSCTLDTFSRGECYCMCHDAPQ